MVYLALYLIGWGSAAYSVCTGIGLGALLYYLTRPRDDGPTMPPWIQ